MPLHIFHLVDIPSPEPAEFPNQEELRVRQADGVANGQSNSDLPTISSRRRICWLTVDCDRCTRSAVRDKLLVSRPQRSCAGRTAPSRTPPGFHSDRRFIPRTGASPVFVSPRVWLPSDLPSADRTDPTDEAFFHESEWIRREIHFEGFAI